MVLLFLVIQSCFNVLRVSPNWKALEGKETTVEDLVRCVAPRLHQVSPVAKAAEGNGKQQGHGSRPAWAGVGSVLGQRTTRTTKIEEDHPVDRKTGQPNPRYEP